MQSIIYSDGASKGNPGKGGWGAIVATEHKVQELGGREGNTTNNRMELMAALEAVKCARSLGVADAILYTDSSYVINGITKWVHGWKKNGWKTSTGGSVINKDIWEDLSAVANSSGIKIKWTHVGGHIGIVGNERVDQIASDLAEGKIVNLYDGIRSTYGIDVLNVSLDEGLKKTKSKTKSKTPAYSYVSEVDGVIKTHKSWHECQDRVNGKRARFKKVLSVEEEREVVKEFSN